MASRCGSDGVEMPLSRYTFEGMGAAVLEAESGACDQILHRAGDQHLARASEPGHAGAERGRAPDGAGRTVEGRKEAIASCVQRTLARHLVGDVEVAALCVLSLRQGR